MSGKIGLMLGARHPEVAWRLMLVDSTPLIGVAFGPPGTTPKSVRENAGRLRDARLAPHSGSPTPLEEMIPGMSRTASMRPAS